MINAATIVEKRPILELVIERNRRVIDKDLRK